MKRCALRRTILKQIDKIALHLRRHALNRDAPGRGRCQDRPMEDEGIKLLRDRLAALQRRLEALESGAIRRAGQQIENGILTAIEITKKQIAQIEERIKGRMG